MVNKTPVSLYQGKLPVLKVQICPHPDWSQLVWLCHINPCCHRHMSYTPLNNSSWAQHSNLLSPNSILIYILMICLNHNCVHAMTALLSWHVQNYGSNGSLFVKWKEHINHICILSFQTCSDTGLWWQYFPPQLYLEVRGQTDIAMVTEIHQTMPKTYVTRGYNHT